MEIAHFLDHTLLRPDATSRDIIQLCHEANQYHFKAVCIPPYFVNLAQKQLENTNVTLATVIGFPFGYASLASKIEEIRRAIEHGADEFDVVINICAVKDKDWNYVKNEINSLCTAVQLKGKIIKIILETGLLDEGEIIHLCTICNEARVDFVKNSTGVNGKGATKGIITLLREHLDKHVKIKAAGGIRTAELAHQLIELGASRLGSSKSIALLH
ncbi:MAG: deoxyribose-phosphate aldolase [Saprospiraceae bacterium]|nr:deoxyribose-phosphate aldolase [Saprospiraceae bacterium]